jgi:hypothetical protein
MWGRATLMIAFTAFTSLNKILPRNPLFSARKKILIRRDEDFLSIDST